MSLMHLYLRSNLERFKYRELFELQKALQDVLSAESNFTLMENSVLSLQERYDKVTWEMTRRVSFGQTKRAQTPPKRIYPD